VVDSAGKIICPDRQMMLYASRVLAVKNGAEIVYDVKCSRHLGEQIRKHGGRPVMWKCGHSLMKAKLRESGAALAGEMSGHIFFNDRWFGFDDALYTAARLLEILAADERTSSEIFADFPDSINTPEMNINVPENEKLSFMADLLAKAHFPDAQIITIDGLRAEFKEGWGLVRASNTTPTLVMRFEADDENALARIQQQFKKLILEIKPDLDLPF
jgi:phosphomannomutase/phosphoglucomutase